MIKKNIHFLLPFLIVSGIILEQAGILHIGYLYIKSHELKWTDLDINYFPREGDIFTAGEQVSNNNYEDAVIAINPSYELMLEQDLKEIADNRTHIDFIDKNSLSFYSGAYQIKACLDKKKVEIRDSTFFKKVVWVEILGNYELYDKDGSDLLYEREDRKFWIRDQIVLHGLSRMSFIENKIKEIWLAQMSNKAHEIIEHFEFSEEQREKAQLHRALQEDPEYLNSTTQVESFLH